MATNTANSNPEPDPVQFEGIAFEQRKWKDWPEGTAEAMYRNREGVWLIINGPLGRMEAQPPRPRKSRAKKGS